MDNLVYWYQALSLIDKIGLWSSIISFITLIPSVIVSFTKIKSVFSKKLIREFLFVYKSAFHYFLTLVIIISVIFYIILSHANILYKFIVILGYIAFSLLFFSFFIRQNKPIMRQLILSHIEKVVNSNNNYVTAIKFDVDLIVAINDYSYTVGNAIVTLLKKVLASRLNELKRSGTYIIAIEIPESDEVIWLLPKIPANRAADIADEIRHEIKSKIKDIPYYFDACDYVIRNLNNPPLNEEEKEGIGTISAGVAAYTRGVEALLSDISSATKEAKFRGRNRTIIYQRDQPAIVREH